MTRRQFFAALGLSCAGLALMQTLPGTAEARNGDGTGPDGNGPRNGRACDGSGPRQPPRDGRGRGQGRAPALQRSQASCPVSLLQEI